MKFQKIPQRKVVEKNCKENKCSEEISHILINVLKPVEIRTNYNKISEKYFHQGKTTKKV